MNLKENLILRKAIAMSRLPHKRPSLTGWDWDEDEFTWFADIGSHYQEKYDYALKLMKDNERLRERIEELENELKLMTSERDAFKSLSDHWRNILFNPDNKRNKI